MTQRDATVDTLASWRNVRGRFFLLLLFLFVKFLKIFRFVSLVFFFLKKKERIVRFRRMRIKERFLFLDRI